MLVSGWWRRSSTLAFLLVAVGVLAVPTPAAAAPAGGEIYVVQGIAGVSGSVTLDGRVVAKDVRTKTVVGPLPVEPGAHTVQLWRGDDAIAQAWFRATPGSSTDVVAHRFPDSGRSPAFTTYRNDVSPAPVGRSRLLVAHTAVAPPTDIVVNGRTLIRNLANGEFATNIVPAGRYDVSVVPTSASGPPILGPSPLTVGPGQLVNVFAIGDPSAGRMDAVVQVLPVGTTGPRTPSRVDTGDGGQAATRFAENRGPGTSTLVGAGLGALIALTASALLIRRSVRRELP